QLLAGLERGHFKSLEWKYMGKYIAEFNSEVVYSPGSQFEGRLKMNTNNFSEGDKGQIGSKTITLKVHEHISKVAIQTNIKLLANHSCTVRLVCNMSCYPNITYTWERDNEIYGDAQQIQFSLSSAERDISVKCNASNLVSWKTASATVKCSNDTTTPGLAWYTINIGVSVGGAVVLILTVAVAVCYCRGRSNTGMYSRGKKQNCEMLYCWHDTGLMVALTLSSPDMLFFRMPQTIGKGIQRK
uniref:Ig-like domain-containing protein n=1 Tax=Hucho hucho TaxID=62062 RepID=A0A4W5PSB2_9TELE